MIIEKFHIDKVKAIYQRFDERGRMLPAGVTYINSWISEDLSTCYQLMEVSSTPALTVWIEHWKDLADFKCVPVIGTKEAREKVFST